MFTSPWLIGVILAAAVIGLVAGAVRVLRRRRAASYELAQESFHQRREWLEADFMTLASQSGLPRGLRWLACDFDDEVAFARDRQTGRYRALVAVTISFEAIEGGGMEEVEAVGNLRAGTVVFRLDGPDWQPDSRAIFNLSPEQTIERYQHELETVLPIDSHE